MQIKGLIIDGNNVKNVTTTALDKPLKGIKSVTLSGVNTINCCSYNYVIKDEKCIRRFGF